MNDVDITVTDVEVLVSGGAVALIWSHNGARWHVWFKGQPKALTYGMIACDGKGLYMNMPGKLRTYTISVDDNRKMVREALVIAVEGGLLTKALELDAQRTQRDQEEFERQRRKAILATFATDMHEALLAIRPSLPTLPPVIQIYARVVLDKIDLTLSRGAPTSATEKE